MYVGFCILHTGSQPVFVTHWWKVRGASQP